MKVLILGIDGMIGHKIAHSLSQDFELYGSSRKDIDIKDLKIPNGKIGLNFRKALYIKKL